MIIFLYGTDRYRLNQSREAIIQKYRAKHSSGLNFCVIDGSDPDAPGILEDGLKSRSFFGEVKLMVLNNIFSRSAEMFRALLDGRGIAGDKECVILATHSGTRNEAKPKELFNLLADKNNLVREFEPLDGPQRTAWLKKEAALRQAPFTQPGLRCFLALGGKDTWQMMMNLEKVANYCRGPITEAAVRLLVTADIEPNIFGFIDALGSRDTAQAFSLLSRELAQGADPYYVLTMIAYQFRNMLIVKDLLSRELNSSAIAKKSGLHPFVVRKVSSVASRFSPRELKDIYGRILRSELSIKGGLADPTDTLFAAALGI